jgi:thiamine pyrophosphate-dependent acetolactate synthase large subunit-like protein
MIARYQAIESMLAHVDDADLILSTTGMISREVFTTKDRPGNFYMLGSMGLLSSLGLGLAVLAPQRRIWVLDGDGSALMSLGTLPLIATMCPPNLIHVILDNEAYESTGAQPTISASVDLAAVGTSCGYRQVDRAASRGELERVLVHGPPETGPRLIVVKVSIAPVEGIPRVSHAPTAIRDRFVAHLQND